MGFHNHILICSILCCRGSIGDGCFLGAGTVVIDNVIIGAISVVVRSIDEPGVYFGNPVQRVKTK